MKTAEFTHLINGKRLTILDKESIAAIIHGDAQGASGIVHKNVVFLVIDKVPAPIPVLETEEQVLNILGLTGSNAAT